MGQLLGEYPSLKHDMLRREVLIECGGSNKGKGRNIPSAPPCGISQFGTVGAA